MKKIINQKEYDNCKRCEWFTANLSEGLCVSCRMDRDRDDHFRRMQAFKDLRRSERREKARYNWLIRYPFIITCGFLTLFAGFVYRGYNTQTDIVVAIFVVSILYSITQKKKKKSKKLNLI